MRNVSIAQAVIVLGCFAAIGFAHYTGPYAGTLVSCAAAYLLWLRQPPSGPMPPAAGKAVAGLVVGVLFGHLVACAPWTAPDVERLRVGERNIDTCEARAVEAGADGWEKTWNDCRAEKGLP